MGCKEVPEPWPASAPRPAPFPRSRLMHGSCSMARLHFTSSPDGSLLLAILPLSEPFLYEARLKLVDVSDTSWL
jgi:hypothetical protein